MPGINDFDPGGDEFAAGGGGPATGVYVEIWRSATGLSDEDFWPFLTVPDASPFQALDAPVAAGQLYIYKARRHDTASGLYSAFSPLAYARAPYPAPGGTMPVTLNTNVSTGIQSKLGIAVEGSPGAAVKAARLLERVDGSLEATISRIKRKAAHNHAGTVGHVGGEQTTDGTLDVEVTPESMDELLCSLAGAPTNAAVTGPPVPAAPTGVIVGAAGAAMGVYTVIARNAQGDSVASPSLTLNTLPAALSAVNYVSLTISPVAGATQYLVLKGGLLLGYTNQLAFSDQGQATAAYAAPAAPSGNVNTYLIGVPARPPLSVTLTERRGNSVLLFGGCQCAKLKLEFDRSQQDPFKAGADMMALYEALGYTEAQLGLDVAGFDPLGGYGIAPGCQINIAGAPADVQKFSAEIDGGLGAKTVLSGFTGPSSFYRKGSGHTVSATAYFSSEYELQRYFGLVPGTPAAPYGPGRTILYFPVYIVVGNPANAAGIVNQFIVQLPNATYEKVGQPYKNKAAIMQDLTIYPDLDPVTGTDVILQTVNSRTLAGITTPGTLITPVPGGVTNPYTN